MLSIVLASCFAGFLFLCVLRHMVGQRVLDISYPSLLDGFVKPIGEEGAPEYLFELVRKWRCLAEEFNYDGPVLWKVRAGLRLSYLTRYTRRLNYSIVNDPPTQSVYVFWIPCLVSGGVQKLAGVFAEKRKKYDLPEHHMSGFGTVTLLSALILSYMQLTGKVLLDDIDKQPHTDSCMHSGGIGGAFATALIAEHGGLRGLGDSLYLSNNCPQAGEYIAIYRYFYHGGNCAFPIAIEKNKDSNPS